MSSTNLSRHELDRRGSRLRTDDASDDACGVAAVLGAVGGVDLVIEIGGGVYEDDVFLDAAGADVTFVPVLGAAEPGGGAPVNGSDVEVVAEAHDPDCHRIPQPAVASYGSDFQFFCGCDLIEFVALPCGLRCTSFCDAQRLNSVRVTQGLYIHFST